MREPTRYFDRASGEVRTEDVYGEAWLRRAYGNPAGRLAVWLLVRRAFFSRWYGRRMNKPQSALRILPFISKYGVDVDDFAKSPFDYKSFNEFFYRALKPERRPIAPGEGVAVLPADGRHLAFPDAGAADGFYVKGSRFTLAELFGPDNPGLAEEFSGAAMLISGSARSITTGSTFRLPASPARPGGWRDGCTRSIRSRLGATSGTSSRTSARSPSSTPPRSGGSR